MQAIMQSDELVNIWCVYNNQHKLEVKHGYVNAIDAIAGEFQIA